jgi:hypothetical protein
MNLGECLLTLRRREVARAWDGLQRLNTTLAATSVSFGGKKALPSLKAMTTQFQSIINPANPKTESQRIRDMKTRLRGKIRN